jgi:hypothetical protein
LLTIQKKRAKYFAFRREKAPMESGLKDGQTGDDLRKRRRKDSSAKTMGKGKIVRKTKLEKYYLPQPPTQGAKVRTWVRGCTYQTSTKNYTEITCANQTFSILVLVSC